MKSLLCRCCAALMLAAMVAGCAAVTPESAMEWMERQPQRIDGPP